MCSITVRLYWHSKTEFALYGLANSVASSRHLMSDCIRKFVCVLCVAESQSAATTRRILPTVFLLECYYDSIGTSRTQASCRAALGERLIDSYCFDVGQRNTNCRWVFAAEQRPIHNSVNNGSICHIKLPRLCHLSGTASIQRAKHQKSDASSY